MIVIKPLSDSQIEIEIPIEHFALGRQWCYRFAERLALAATLDAGWYGTMLKADRDRECCVVKVTRDG